MISHQREAVRLLTYHSEFTSTDCTRCIKREKIWQAHQRTSREELPASFFMLEVLILIMRTQVLLFQVHS